LVSPIYRNISQEANYGRNADKGSHLTLRAAVLEVPFSIWFVGSVLGFVLVLV
jgi:hypothetical protein